MDCRPASVRLLRERTEVVVLQVWLHSNQTISLKPSGEANDVLDIRMKALERGLFCNKHHAIVIGIRREALRIDWIVENNPVATLYGKPRQPERPIISGSPRGNEELVADWTLDGQSNGLPSEQLRPSLGRDERAKLGREVPFPADHPRLSAERSCISSLTSPPEEHHDAASVPKHAADEPVETEARHCGSRSGVVLRG